MKIKSSFLITAIIVFALGIFSGCKKKENQGNNTEINQIIPVSVTTAQKKDISNLRSYGGSLEGIQQSNIVAKIAERIVSINASVGQYVKAGEIVVTFDKTGPSSQYIQAKANYENLQRELDRMNALYKDGAVAKQAVDQAQTACEVSKANYDASKNAVELVSPISGKITAINVNPGDWVTPGTVLAVIADINSMLVTFNVSESEIGNLKTGTPVKVYSEFNKDLVRQGKIIELNRSASLDARSFRIKARFLNTPDNFYKPGMFVKADVTLETKHDVLVVPTASVINERGNSIIYIIKNNRSFLTGIKSGFNNEDFTEVTDGLSEGDTVVTAGMNNLSDSTRVSIAAK